MNAYFLVYLIGYCLMIVAVWFGLDAAGIGSTWKIVAVLFLAGLGIIYAFSNAQTDTAQREQARNAGSGDAQGGGNPPQQGNNPQQGNPQQGEQQGGASQG